MSLYSEWQDLISNQTDDTFEAFWKEYSETETKIYKDLLGNYKENLKGTVEELVAKYDCNKVIFVGFLDGINESLNNGPIDLEKVDESTAIELDVDYEKLFFNMLKAEADYLYSLEEWTEILTEDQAMAILKDYKRSKIVHAEKKPGRNDPCPCGSGKKYKKCCGKNA